MKKADAIAFFGSPTALAAALGITRTAVYQWGELVPKERRYEIEVKSGGQLKAEPETQQAEAAP